jgi:hypothetical protein
MAEHEHASVSIEKQIAVLVSADAVREEAIEQLAGAEISSRTNLVVQAIKSLRTLADELKRVKPDQASYNDKGEVVSESFSKQAIESRNKLQARIEKLEDALKQAVEENEFDRLRKQLNEK